MIDHIYISNTSRWFLCWQHHKVIFLQAQYIDNMFKYVTYPLSHHFRRGWMPDRWISTELLWLCGKRFVSEHYWFIHVFVWYSRVSLQWRGVCRYVTTAIMRVYLSYFRFWSCEIRLNIFTRILRFDTVLSGSTKLLLVKSAQGSQYKEWLLCFS